MLIWCQPTNRILELYNVYSEHIFWDRLLCHICCLWNWDKMTPLIVLKYHLRGSLLGFETDLISIRNIVINLAVMATCLAMILADIWIHPQFSPSSPACLAENFINRDELHLSLHLIDTSLQSCQIRNICDRRFLASNPDCFLWALLKLEIALEGTFERL